MANNNLYIDDLTTKSTQSTPDCFARIIRFIRRDTRDYAGRRPKTIINEGIQGIRHVVTPTEEETKSVPLDIASDILSCTITKSKGSSSGSFTMVLASGDIDYHHAINIGDHILIWMKRNRAVNASKGADKLLDKSITNNKKNSGLKMYGVITGVRKIFKTNPNGTKLLLYQVTGKDFGFFFEASVYYNAAATGLLSDTKFFEFTVFGSFGAGRPDQMINAMVDTYLGAEKLQKIRKETGIADKNTSDRSLGPENIQMLVPSGIQDVFRKGNTFSKMLDKRIGLEKYTNGSFRPTMNPMVGYKLFHVDVGANYPLWSVLQAYSNPTMNEMFLDLKVRPHNGEDKIFPTFVMRQIPFTSKLAAQEFSNSKVTNFTFTTFAELPRIKIPEKFIMSENLGRGDHERFNFIELFGIFPGLQDLIGVPMQMVMGNYAIDVASVKRYGLRTLIAKTDFHFPDLNSIDKSIKDHKEVKSSMAPVWINILADWYLGAHTLETGSMELVGIEEPLSIGDNIEIERLNGVAELYHVEGYSHNYSVDTGNGHKSFRTSVNLSRGQRVDEYPIYTSGSLNENDLYDVGLTDTEFEGTARSETSDGGRTNSTGISPNEIPLNRKKQS